MKKVKWMALIMATMVLMSGCGDKKVEEFKVTEEDSTSSYVYVEQRQEVDFVDNASYMIGMSKDTKGTLHMFGMSEEEGYLHYVSDDTVSNGESSNVSWLAQEAPIDSAWVMDAKSDQEGHIVACVQNLEGETYFVGEQEDSIRKRELEINPGGFEITKNNDLLVVYNTEAVFMNWDGEAKKAFDTLRGNGKKYFSWDNLSYYGWLAYYGTRFFAAGSGGIGRRLFEDT